MLCYAMLCYAMLDVLRFAMLCYAMLCYDMLDVLRFAMLCYAMLCYAMLCYAKQFNDVSETAVMAVFVSYQLFFKYCGANVLCLSIFLIDDTDGELSF